MSSGAFQRALVLGLAVLLGACQNMDLKRPATVTRDEDGRTFTRLGEDEPGPLTNAVASRRIGEISRAETAERLMLIEEFLADFPAARTIPLVHELAGEAALREGDFDAAAESYERAVILQRTDLTGLPLNSEPVLKIGMARFNGGASVQGLEWLVRASLIDRSESLQTTLRWAHGEAGIDEEFEAWIAARRRQLGVVAPGFDLPGLQEPRVTLTDAKVTVINFWSPT